jgi:hypothetical protein
MNMSIRKTTYERENLAQPQTKPHILKKIQSSSAISLLTDDTVESHPHRVTSHQTLVIGN